MAWLSGWDYRKKITVAGQSGAGTGYQIPLNIGASSGGDLHLEAHSTDFPAAENDGGDLRFTTDDGTTLLDFWVETGDGTDAKIWVEVAGDLGSNVDIYCYYGKSGASNDSNGADTFPMLFDTFNTDTSGSWTATGGSWTWETGNSRIKASNVNYHALVSNVFSETDKYEIHLKEGGGNRSGSDYLIHGIMYRYESLTQTWHIRSRYLASAGYNPILYDWDGTAGSRDSGSGANPTLTHRYQAGVDGNNHSCYVDGGGFQDTMVSSDASHNDHTKVAISSRQQSTSSYIYFDYIFAKKYQAIEPDFSAADAEEEAPPLGATIQKSLIYAVVAAIAAITKSLEYQVVPSDKDYTRGDEATLPTNDNNLETAYVQDDYLDVATDNAVRINQSATGQFAIHLYKKTNDNSTDEIPVTWNGQSDIAPSVETIYLQIYNRTSGIWETLDSNSVAAANTDFTLSGSKTTSLGDYYDGGNEVAVRIYQEAP